MEPDVSVMVSPGTTMTPTTQAICNEFYGLKEAENSKCVKITDRSTSMSEVSASGDEQSLIFCCALVG